MTTVASDDVERARRELRGMVGSGSRRPAHHSKIRPSERSRLLRLYRDSGWFRAFVVAGDPNTTVVQQRSVALRALATRFAEMDEHGHLILDHVHPHQQHVDRLTLAHALDSFTVRYEHASASTTDPLMWVADGVAWAAGLPEWQRLLGDWIVAIAP